MNQNRSIDNEGSEHSKHRHHSATFNKILKVAVVVFAAAALSVAFYCIKLDKNEPETGESPHSERVIKYNGESFSISNDIETLLVIGRDKFDEEVAEDIGDYYNDQQADFLMYIVFDNANQEVRFIQINRDTMCDVQWLTVNGLVGGTEVEQICLAHTYGSGGKDSCENTADAVCNLLFDAPVDSYISFTMDSVGKINDLVGGVTVTVEEDLTSVDEALIKGQTVKLSGDQALHFVRARRGIENGDNRNRMKRQRQYLDSFVEAAHNAAEQNDNLSSDAFALLKDSLVTNLSSSEVTGYADKLNTYKLGDISHADGTVSVGADTGWVEFYVDKDNLWEILTRTLTA